MRGLVYVIVCLPVLLMAQGNGFDFGSVSPTDFTINFDRDSTSDAIVLNEFGEVYFDMEYQLHFEYHVKVGILKKEGSRYANFSIPLRKDAASKEELISVEAASFQYLDGKITSQKISQKDIYTEDAGQYWSRKNFTVPNVQVGGIVEIKYEIKSPFVFNLRPWEFQGDLPKTLSEFWVKIPANYVYNIVLKGTLPLSKNESQRVPECMVTSSGKADCARFKYAIKNVPAFKEEEYMTAKSNFLSAIEFELSEVRYFNGSVQKFTETWDDVNLKLIRDPDFGTQIKRGSKDAKKVLADQVAFRADSLALAIDIYNYIKNHISWDGYYGKYTDKGIKKALEEHKGNVADINLTLISSLQAFGFNAGPVILATRDSGLPRVIHPVLSDFNYVVTLLSVSGKKYLLDATEPLYQFGVLPLRCINGKGRSVGKNPDWIELQSTGKDKQNHKLELTLSTDGVFTGTLTINHYEYSAAVERNRLGRQSLEDFKDQLDAQWPNLSVLSLEIENSDDIYQPLVEKMQVEFSSDAFSSSDICYLNPFQTSDLAENPFKSKERNYPIDFGPPLERAFTLSLSFPENFTVDELPATEAFSLPKNGGKFLLDVSQQSDKILLSNNYSINRTTYSATEYPALREFFNKAVQTHQSQIVFKITKDP